MAGRPRFCAEQVAFNETVGERVKEARERVAMSTLEAAIRLEVDVSLWRKWEAGSRAIDAWRLVQIAKVLGCTASELLGEQRGAGGPLFGATICPACMGRGKSRNGQKCLRCNGNGRAYVGLDG